MHLHVSTQYNKVPLSASLKAAVEGGFFWSLTKSSMSWQLARHNTSIMWAFSAVVGKLQLPLALEKRKPNNNLIACRSFCIALFTWRGHSFETERQEKHLKKEITQSHLQKYPHLHWLLSQASCGVVVSLPEGERRRPGAPRVYTSSSSLTQHCKRGKKTRAKIQCG